MKQIDEREIIGRVLGGETEAFGVLVDLYKGPVFRLAFRMTGSAQDADDLTQESFLRAYQSLRRFKVGKRFFPWLYTVSLNVIRNHLRKANTLLEEAAGQKTPRATDSRDDPAEAAMARERGMKLQGYLLKLPVPVREALVLRFYESMSFEDIARVTEDTLSSAKMKVYRGLEKTRRMMEADGFTASD
ncbi:MAG TPA: RNA polymerase sigma factor [Syntrophales bacterium]|nr:RNA polymerase sigma factor [Syntrophales bacterium]